MNHTLSQSRPKKKHKVTVMIMIDGLRPDYVHPASMPFLKGLSRQGSFGCLEATPGTSQGAAMLLGQYPDTAQVFEPHAYQPQKNPVRDGEDLRPVERVGTNKRFRLSRRLVTRRVQATTGSWGDVWIPHRYQPFFEHQQGIVYPHGGQAREGSVLDLCTKNALKQRWLQGGDKTEDHHAFTAAVRALREPDAPSLLAIKLGALEGLARAYGPFSHTVQTRALHDLDEKLASIHAALTSNHEHWDYLLCGTRGMAPVERTVDVLSALHEADAKPGRDYVLYVGDTLVRVWYRSKRGHREIEYLLPKVDGAYAVDEHERRRLRIPKGRLGGDRLLAARPGVLFSPSFVHANGPGCLGMNGYLDKETEGHPPVLFASSEYGMEPKKVGLRPMVDVFPTLCQLIGVRPTTPHEGQSMVHEDAPPAWSRKFIQQDAARVVSDA